MLALVVVTGLLLSAMPGDAEQARAEFERGAALYRAGDYRGALAAFEAAQAHRPAPEALFNIARCHERLGELADAVDTYRAYLEARPSAPDRQEVAEHIDELQSRLPLEGSLRISVEPPASVSVDGDAPQPSPRSVQVPPGRHRIRAEQTGHLPLEREVDLAAGARVQLELSLVPALPPESATSLPPAAVSRLGRGEPRKGERRWTWVAAGVSAACLVAGVGFGISAHQAQDNLRNGQVREQDAAQQIYDSARARNTAATAFYVAAGVSGAAAIALFFLEPHLGTSGEGR